MARRICIQPCPAVFDLPQFTIPLMGGPMQAQGQLNTRSGCNSCDLMSAIMGQLSPLMGSLGLPLCLLGCMTALVNVSKALEDALGPPPDPSKIATAVTQVITKCECVVGFALPPPVGVICDFLKLVRDIINIVAGVINCVVGILEHLITLNLKANINIGSNNPDIAYAGTCLLGQTQVMMDTVNGKMGAMAVIFSIIQPVVSLIESALPIPGPFKTQMDNFASGFASFGSSTPSGTGVTAFSSALNTFNTVVQDVAIAVTDIVSICP